MKTLFLLTIVLLTNSVCFSQGFTLANEAASSQVGKDCKLAISPFPGSNQVSQYYVTGKKLFSGADGVSLFKVAPATGQLIGGIDLCNEKAEDPQNPTKYVVKATEKYLIYTASCGGKDKELDSVMRAVIEKATGKLAYYYSDSKIFKLGEKLKPSLWEKLPKRIKESVYATKAQASGVKCSDGTKFVENEDASSREQILAVIENSEGIQKFLSYSELATLSLPSQNNSTQTSK